MAKRFFITTPIYYVNDKPHIGHAYTTIIADVLTRFHKINQEETFFLTGTDEHGTKVAEAAKQLKKSPQQLCDENSQLFKRVWEKLNIQYDYFIRTTEKRHIEAVKKLLNNLNTAQINSQKVIYPGSYKGLYCIGCEKFITEKELKVGLCPNHLTKPQVVQEKNYFFRLSEFLKPVEKLIKEGAMKILPEERKAETLGLLAQNLEDFSISREKVTWGVPLPFDPLQIAYVWVDALPNYISAIGYGDNPQEFDKWWNDSQVIHLMAKDILKFHAVYWPAMLLALGLKIPDLLFIHGFFTVNGQKMSKTLGNVIDPNFLVEKFGSDATRYLLLTQFPLGLDGDIQESRFTEKYNSELANDLGNLVSRVIKMISDWCEGKIPNPSDYDDKDNELKNLGSNTPKKVMEHIYQIGVTGAIDEIFKLIRKTNQYIEISAPWNLAKNKESKKLNTKLYVAAEVLRIISSLIYPVMPNKALQIRKMLGLSDKEVPDLTEEKNWGNLKPGLEIGKMESLFPRMESKTKSGNLTKESIAMEENLVGIEDFQKLDLRVAKVLEAEAVPGTSRLLKLKVEVGDKQKQIVAGIAEHYKPEELVGKKVVVVNNMKPTTIRGVESEGMILVAKDGKGMVLLGTEKEIETGAKIS
ncbi:MAG: hypothetical protein RBG1_1C00001G0317 [candidate division Zixibacteria bacterium RBG-1]|nr:MAG: hypothetical protein RBG1_1C00001G0317 [candidate division Zixibacteria bacterium RBG-1]OGC83151.1 MAG: hypothetical protein A2V73_06935 [candidate division Zixibacteria bacterium RBG_19FT_COMBO_42_43]